MTGRLTALLDTLLPGDGGDWPAAGAHGLAVHAARLADDMLGGAEAMAGVLDALPKGFVDLPQLRREEFLHEIEAQDAARFDAVITAAYNAYYTDPAIRDIIERLTGYPNRPPQPEGYVLDPFDESLLDAVKARGPIWRLVD
mgnify:CR=1 FL=1|tara:strand:+ start:7435 stop:7860 length:426 start_codon:yes stop_codon:yes gene_type:complete